MSKYRTFFAFLISSVLLAIVISQNRELFFFAKTIRPIEWTLPFGDPLIAISLLVAPLLATLVLFSDSDWGNILFQYIWSMVLGCLAGAVITLALALLIRKWLR